MRYYSLKEVIAEAIEESKPKALPPPQHSIDEYYPALIDSTYALREIKDTLLKALIGGDVEMGRVKPALMFTYNKLKGIPATAFFPTIPFDIIRLLKKYDGLPEELLENGDVQADLLSAVDNYIEDLNKVVQHVAKLAFRELEEGDTATVRYPNGFPVRVSKGQRITVIEITPNFAIVEWDEGGRKRTTKVMLDALQLMDFVNTEPLDLAPPEKLQQLLSPKDEPITVEQDIGFM